MFKYIFKKRQANYLLSAISGIAVSISFIFPALWWICFIAFTPFIYIVFKKDCIKIKHFILYVLIFNTCIYFPILTWLYNLHTQIPFNKILSYLLIFLCIVMIVFLKTVSLLICLSIFKILRNFNILDTILFSFSYIINEYLSEIFLNISFPWFKIGVIATPYAPFIQSANLFGEKFISLIIILLNSLTVYCFINRITKKKVIMGSIIFLIVLTGNIGYGYLRIWGYEEPSQIKGMVIQGNYSDRNKWDTPCKEIFDTYCRLTKEYYQQNTQIILWPETTITVIFDNDDYYKSKLTALAKELDSTIITGTFTQSSDKEFEYNSLVAISPDGNISKPHCKRYLAPFGEYMPFESLIIKIIPSVQKYLCTGHYVARGEKSIVLDFNGYKAGGLICYESLFTKAGIQATNDGAGILLIATNDSWFGETKAIYEHHAHAKMRAVENNRYVMHAGNTGYSSIISPLGEVISEATPFEVSACSGYIEMIYKETFYSKHPNFFIFSDILLIFIYIYVKLKEINIQIIK